MTGGRSLGVRTHARVNAVPLHIADQTPSQVWHSLLEMDDFERAIVERVRSLVADATHHHQRGRQLRAAGLDAANGLLAERLVALDLAPEHALHQRALRLLWNLDSSVGLDAALQVLQLLADTDTDPDTDAGLAVDVIIDRTWFDQRADQRRRTLELIRLLAMSADVDLVASGYTQRRLVETHYDDLTPGVREACKSHPRQPEDIDADHPQLAAAFNTLDPDSPTVALLRHLGDQDTGIASYDDLDDAAVDTPRRTVRTRIKKLADRGLVETFGPDRDRRVEITPLGRRYLTEVGRQSRLGEGVFAPPKSIDNSRGSRARSQDNPPDRPTASGGDTDAHTEVAAREAAAAAAPEDGRYRMQDGPAGIRYWNRRREAVYRRLAPDRGIALHDYPVEEQDERRAPSWGYDEDDDHLVVGAEYDNPMQYAVCVARALASRRTWERVLTRSRVDDGGDLAGLALQDNNLLRDLTDIGWLDRFGADTIDRDDLLSAIDEARDDLLDLTHELKRLDDDPDVLEEEYLAVRGEVADVALGLIGSMEMLLWLAGVEVSKVVKIPEYNKSWTGDDHEDRRRDLARHLGVQAAIGSQHHGQPLYRQLYEQRESKQRRAIDPRPDLGSAVGHTLAQVLVVGPSVEKLEPLLEEYVEHPVEERADAPDVAARIPIRTSVPRDVYAGLIAWELQDKGGLRPSTPGVNLLKALLPSPIDALEAVRYLGAERETRGLRLDEVRYAVATALEQGAVDDDRLLPDVTPSQRAIVHALLVADRPLTGAEVYTRAEVSDQSWRDHRDHLKAMGLLAETSQGWRLPVPFDSREAAKVREAADDRRPTPDVDDGVINVVAPWYLLTEVATAADLLQDAVDARLPAGAMADPDHPVASVFFQPPPRDWSAVFGEYPDLEPWLRVARDLTAAPDPPDRAITMGVRAPQKRLTAYTQNDSSKPVSPAPADD